MDDLDLYWTFIDLHNELISTVNDISCRWDLNELMAALRGHKIKTLMTACLTNINHNYDALIDDSSYLMLAFKDETDQVALVSAQTVDTITFKQLRDLAFAIWDTQRVLMNYTFMHLNFKNLK